MRILLNGVLISLLGITAQAANQKETIKPTSTPPAVLKLANKLKGEVRTVIKETYTSKEDANPCNAVGKGYLIAVQVKKPIRTEDIMQVKYVWETVREVASDEKGQAMEICGE